MSSLRQALDGTGRTQARDEHLLRVRRFGSLALALISFAVLGAHAYLGSYSRFIADDYCSAAEARRLGILRAAWYWFLNWNGRFSANVLDALFGGLGPSVTPIITGIVLVLWTAVLAGSLFLVLRSLGDHGNSPWLCTPLAALIIFLTLAIAPNVPQALYWGQGLRSIIPPLIIMTAYVGLFVWWRGLSMSRADQWLTLGISFLLAYGAGGFNETYTALQLAGFGIAVGTWLVLPKRAKRAADAFFLSAGLIGAALAFITVLASPGNSERAAFYPPPPPFFALLGIAIQSYGAFFLGIFASGTRTLALVAAFLGGLWIGAWLKVRVASWRAHILILFTGLVLTFSCFPPAAYGESQAPPERTLLIPAFLLVLTLFALGISIGAALVTRWNALALVTSVALLSVATAACLSLLQMRRMLPEYQAYASAWSQFHTEMVGLEEAGVSNTTLSTAGMNENNWTGLNVLGDNPKFWLNKCVSDYYGVKVISNSP